MARRYQALLTVKMWNEQGWQQQYGPAIHHGIIDHCFWTLARDRVVELLEIGLWTSVA